MAITQRGTRLLAADPGYGDQYGAAVAVSSDGLVMAVGAPFWDGGTYNDQGAVYIYDLIGGAWVMRGSVLVAGDVAAHDDRFGSALALSADGAILAVGAPRREVGANTNQGAVYIYDYTGGTWVQRGGVLTPASAGANYYMGGSVALSDDGAVIAIGSAVAVGIHAFDYSGGTWNARAVVSPALGGAAIALNGTGSMLAIGAPQTDTSFTDDGAVWIYDWSGSAWSVRGAKLVAGNPAGTGYFGIGTALSSDGTVLAVGAYNWSGVSNYRGGIYLFDYTGGSWVQRGDMLVSADSIVGFYNPALSADASVLVVGGPTYDDSTTNQGAVYTYDVALDNYVVAPTELTMTLSTAAPTAPTALTVISGAYAATALTLVDPSGQASAATALSMVASGQASAATVLALVDAADARNWSARCLIAGVDVSAQLTRQASVTFEEGAARIASLVLLPPSGAIDPLDYVGQPISLDYVLLVGGTPVPRRLFTGRIDTPEYDPASTLLTLTCVDDLQNRVASLDLSVIDGLVGGRYSAAVQGEFDDHWDYAEARLTTVAGSLDAGASGGMRVTPWEIAATWATFGDADLIYERPRLSLPQRSTLINTVDIEFEYRYARLRQRYTTLGWSGTQIDMAPCGYQYPTQQDILGAAGGSGWTVTLGVFYPAPAAIPHSSGGFIYPADGAIDMAILHLTQRHSQTVSERYTLQVTADESVAQNGTLPHPLRGALESSFDGGAWESALDVVPLLTGGGEQDWAPDAPRADADHAIQTLLDQALVKIHASHRGARVGNAILCNPDLDLDKKVAIATTGVTASGKVASGVHVLDFAAGSATTEFEIAIFGAGGAGIITPTTLAPPTPPAESAETQAWPSSIPSLFVNTFGVTPYSDGLMGLLINPPETLYVEDVPGIGAQSIPNPSYTAGSYPVTGFRVQMPGVDDADRNPLDKPTTANYSIVVPTDPLAFTVP
ncbi:MAG: FG-GAP repeat protein [Nevskia sp.]|jgi:hypothetical protein|nr:FG-GAP repeat protein [Nevskia sp.]